MRAISLFGVTFCLLSSSPATAAGVGVLPPIAVGKKADWKAAAKLEKALENALSKVAGVISTKVLAGRDAKLGKKTIGCADAVACLGKLAVSLDLAQVLAVQVAGRGKRQAVTLTLASAAGRSVGTWTGVSAGAGAAAAELIAKASPSAAPTATVPSAGPVAAAAPAVADDGERDSVAIMDFSATDIDAKFAAQATDGAVLGVHRLKMFDVIGGDDIRALLDQQQLKDAISCENTSCLADLGGALDARYMISGKIAKTAAGIQVNVTLMDVYNARAVGREQRTITDIAKLGDEVSGATRKLFNPILAASGGTITVRCSEVGAGLYVDGDLRTTSTGRLFRATLPGGTHRLEAKKQGFVTWAKDLDIGPESEQMISVEMLPSQDFIKGRMVAAKRQKTVAMAAAASAGAFALGAVGAVLVANNSYEAGEAVMLTGCTKQVGDDVLTGQPCIQVDTNTTATTAWARMVSTANAPLSVDQQAGGLTDALQTYQAHHGDQARWLLIGGVSVGLSAASAGFAVWQWMNVEETGKWEQYLIEESAPAAAAAPEKASAPAPAASN
jgi:TolB-like protein